MVPCQLFGAMVAVVADDSQIKRNKRFPSCGAVAIWTKEIEWLLSGVEWGAAETLESEGWRTATSRQSASNQLDSIEACGVARC